MSHEGPGLQPENKLESLETVGNQLHEIAEKLRQRNNEGFNLLFTLDSDQVFEKMAQALQSADNQNAEAVAREFQQMVEQLGHYAGEALVDDTNSLRRLAHMFGTLSVSLETLGVENPALVVMVAPARRVANVLTRKASALEEYLSY